MISKGLRVGDSQAFSPSGFFALRTPLLSFDELLNWAGGTRGGVRGDDPPGQEREADASEQVLRDRLKAVVDRPEIREAMFLASPSLMDRLHIWAGPFGGKEARKVECALVRYFVRMTGRATPFGLFAGCTVGEIGNTTRLRIRARQEHRRHTRLDMDYLVALTDALSRDSTLRQGLPHYPNSSLVRAAGRIHLAEARLDSGLRSHHLVAIEADEYLETVLRQLRPGAFPGDLAAALVAFDDELSLREAREYVEELIDSQLLVSELAPPVTGDETLARLIERIKKSASGAPVARCLEGVRRSLDDIDSTGLGVSPERFLSVANQLRGLPAPVSLPKLFQVDMITAADSASLGEAPMRDIMRGVRILHAFSGVRRDPLHRFREMYLERYGEREMPLAEVLDEEVGIGFRRSSAPSAEAAPILDGLFILPAIAGEDTAQWRQQELLLLRKLEAAWRDGASEIALTSSDLERLPTEDLLPLPDAFAALAVLIAGSESEIADESFRILIKSVSGPSGATLLSRFCHADKVLRACVERHLREEESVQPEGVFAEIVHLPEGRVGNILSRPSLREYEIPFLGVSGVPKARQISLSDLYVSVTGGRVVLRSERLNREVYPRLSTAHNYTVRSLGVYGFLCALQQQGVSSSLGWNWGPFRGARFLPRVVCERLVLSRARWNLGRDELDTLVEDVRKGESRRIEEWRVKRHLPRFSLLADGDNELVVDFHNPLSLSACASLLKNRSNAVLLEMIPGPDELCAKGPEGRFVHELVVPFVRNKTASRPGIRPTPRDTPRSRHSYPPGSIWLYVKLYTGSAAADGLLCTAVRSLVKRLTQSGAIDRWFFVRYGDPDWHLRLRLHLLPGALREAVLPLIHDVTGPLLEQGSVWRVQLDTYEQEVARYGGPVGMELAEGFFHADSIAVLAVLDTLAGDAGVDARWRLTLRGIDMLLADLDFDLEAKLAVLKRTRGAFGREFLADKPPLKHQLGERFRRENDRTSLVSPEALLNPENDAESPFEPALTVLRERSRQMAPIVRELRHAERTGGLSVPLAGLAPSYIHMFANRLLRSSHRAQELVIHDFLVRLYESRLARMRKSRR